MTANAGSKPEAPERRVLFLARHLDSGGVTTHMMSLALGLMQRGWKVGLVSGGMGGDHDHGPAWFEAGGIPHFQAPFIGPDLHLGDLFKPLVSAKRVHAAVGSFRPSLVHVHWRSTSIYAALEATTRRVPFVTTLHLEGIPAKGVFRFGSKWGCHTIAVSQEARDHLISVFGVPPDRITIVHNGVDPDVFHPPTPAQRASAREKFGLDPAAPVVCLIGRLEPVKAHCTLLEAAGLVQRAFPRLQLLFAGEGSLLEQIRGFARSKGLEQSTHFVGYAKSQSVLWASDMLVLPSYQEGFALAPVEAMLCGVPVIRTPAGGAAEQITDGLTGFVVPFDDHSMLAERMRVLLSDPESTRRIADAARARALDHFTVDVMVRATESVYLRVIDQARRAR
jgi:glycosyltransferase involved in cell wall biosynthesis